MYWASEIEWPMVRHSRDKKIKGCFERVRLRIAGGQKGPAVVAVYPRRNKGVLFKFLNSGNFLTLTVLELLNLAGEDGWWSGIQERERNS
jgi:hypothetical protein